MQFSLKEAICQTLGNKQIFSNRAIEEYLRQSDYHNKETWAQTIQTPGKVSLYVTSLEDDVSKCRRHSFRLLSLIQLEELMKSTTDEEILKYMRALHCLHDKKTTVAQRAKFQNMCDKMEIKILNRLASTESCKCDVRKFLMAAMLMGNKQFLYSEENKAALSRLRAML